MTRPQTCSRCGEEVRYGQRGGVTGWLHREDKDHLPGFGRLWTPEDSERLNADLDRLRVRPVGEVDEEAGVQKIEFYTMRRVGLKGEAAKAHDALRAPEAKALPPVEVWGHTVTPDDPLVPQGARLLAELVTGVTRLMPNGKNSKSPKYPPAAPGWELRRLTHARGPYVGSSGECLSISDTIVLGARGPEVDGKPNKARIVAASWRDNAFDFAYAGILDGSALRTRPVNSNALKAWVRGEGDLSV